MSEIMSQLHLDHVNLSRLLDVLKAKLVDLKAGERPDYRLMLDVVTYIVDYADDHHHPLEDQIYDYAIAHYPRIKAPLDAVEAEHKQIRQSTQEFQQMIDTILMDRVIPMEHFNQCLDDFIQQQYAHLNQEEGKVFPLLEETLQPQDWQQLSAALVQRDDPLFGDNVADEYKRLYKLLTGQSAAA